MEIIQYQDKWIGAAVYRSVKKEFLKDATRPLNELCSEKVIMNIFKSDPVISLKQIHAAAISSLLAFKSKSNIAKNLGIEILLRISSETQIERALKKLGIDESAEEAGVCIISEDYNELEEARGMLSLRIGGVELSEEDLHDNNRVVRALEFYSIKDEDLKVIQAKNLYEAALFLILEKIATLDLYR
ncbi:MAG: KEOPS complex subunit Cgi121 [Aigarchaeota archaeon]|nr:KEOPS complex subunit Cgi121 [Aigarchaeota archaeon]MCX8192569.1 KEOPS complex subunit Cgi121 [Nitrososphaeria archaeon]MDW7985695.1 KEOPS complex subunit Cgi121 [Nitrososphaerota archaeon]